MAQESAKEEACLGAVLLNDLKGQEHRAVPRAWRAIFAKDHLDGAVFLGLFSSCRSGRDLAIRPYLFQVTTLEIAPRDIDSDILWHHLWTCTASKLTEFKTSAYLDNRLVFGLQERAPALKTISAHSVACKQTEGGVLTIADYSNKEWAVDSITFQAVDDLWPLARLPKSKADKVDVYLSDPSVPMVCPVRSVEGFHGDILPWLPGWCFHATDIHIQPAKTLRAQDHTPALSNALRQARDLQAPHATVHVNKWEWNNALHTNVTTVLPALSHLKFALYIDACVTSAMLEPLTKVPHCNVLSAFHLDLSSVRHAEASWPWEELWVRDVDMTQMLHLPKPEQASGARRVMRFNYMSFAGVGEACAPRLRKWLQHVTWTPMKETGTRAVLFVPTGQNELRDAKAQLSALKAVHFSTPQALEGLTVHIRANLTPKMMQLLCDLPDGPRVLDLQGCSWPQGATEYKALAQYIPASYTEWRLDSSAEKVATGIYDGVNEHRAFRLSLPPLRLGLYGYNGPEMKVGNNIIVSGVALA